MKLATVISRLSDPFIMFGATLLILFWQSNQLLPILIVCVIVPFIFFVVAWKTSLISNWDVTERKQRPMVLWILFAIEVIGSLIFHLTGLFPFLIMLLGFILITHVWKISGHTFASATLAAIVTQTFGIAWWPMLILPLIVGWSRVYRKNHTIAQAIAGGIYPIVCMYFFL